MRKLAYIAAAASAAAMLAACSHSSGWKVSGTVANAPADAKLAVQRFNGAVWYTVDSVAIAPDGSFAYAAAEAAPYADVYRLGLDGRSIYFPIQATEAVTIDADANAFDSGYSLGGSPLAEQMMQIDRDLAGYTPANAELKTQLNNLILADSTGVISYYVINKTINGRPLYDATDRADVRMIGAIANKFDQLFPADPRTKFLAQRFIQARSALAAAQDAPVTIDAPEISLFDIELLDNLGQKQSLSDLAEKHPLMILSFTSYEIEPSLAYNIELNNIYDKCKDKGLEIYQVAFDDDENNWFQAAGNLPWVTVRAAGHAMQQVMTTYNIYQVPTTFIIANGTLVERVENPADLASAIAKY